MGQPARRTARRRRLGGALKDAREAAQVSAIEAAQAIHGDNTKISRIETGRHRVTRLELETLLNLYQVKDEQTRDWLIALASEGRKRSWWRQHSDALPPGLKELLTLESDAAKICAFQSQVIPGLLQTREYATAVMAGAEQKQMSTEKLDFFVDLRMNRQQIFQQDNAPSYLCIMPEGVVRQQLGGPKVMAAQLRHLIALNRPPMMTIQVIPFSQGAFTATGGSFVLYSYPDPLDLDVVQVEYLDGALYLEEDETVEKYRSALDGLRAAALSSQQSVDLISSIARDLEGDS
ncbi:DNA-binding protein [Streptomyces cinnamoneus]|uniref:DNA-binding protein n=1 Tax=Streptomyces cinnamoneus TaxID=53446 RepID=A0A2G1XF78_STRCJ|nr:helix-turn-helix transcriptional regulator [Streptomyces cinnamoneus]PHQ49890.1 DNA-binding protein [Streptomyces cinnamoneus]PPT13334.1 XRE family transcriptional regulator [Streptomyces cinnamoneus]